MFMYILVLVFVVILFYTWVGYPLVLRFVSVASPAVDVSKKVATLPRVAIVLSAYNEEKCLQARLDNLLTVDYPAELVSIYVGLDGCSDESSAIVAIMAGQHDNIHLHDFSERRGKVAVLKDLVALIRGVGGGESILVFTDANSMFRSDALTKLLLPFDDDKVGGVCGRLIFLPLVSDGDVDDGDSPESSYWGWETRLKMAESVLDSCLGANGAIYAMRSELFWDKIADNTLIDDFVLGMKIREQGLRMVYEPDAVAEEVLPVQTAEWGRRVRIGAGAYQSLGFCGRCLLPSYGKFSWMFWSHKVLRWFTPHLLLFLLGCLSYWLVAGSGENQILHVGITSCVIVVMSIAMFFAKKTGLRDSRLAQPFLLLDHFVTMQVALFFGFVRYCRGGLKGQWTRTPRSSE